MRHQNGLGPEGYATKRRPGLTRLTATPVRTLDLPSFSLAVAITAAFAPSGWRMRPPFLACLPFCSLLFSRLLDSFAAKRHA